MNYGCTVLNPMTRAIIDPTPNYQGSLSHWGKMNSEVVLAPEYTIRLGKAVQLFRSESTGQAQHKHRYLSKPSSLHSTTSHLYYFYYIKIN